MAMVTGLGRFSSFVRARSFAMGSGRLFARLGRLRHFVPLASLRDGSQRLLPCVARWIRGVRRRLCQLRPTRALSLCLVYFFTLRHGRTAM